MPSPPSSSTSAAEAIVEVAQDATSDLVTKDYFHAELYRALWFFGIGIITVNLAAIGIATGILIAVN